MFRLYARLLGRSAGEFRRNLKDFKEGTAQMQAGASTLKNTGLDHLDRRAEQLYQQAMNAGDGDPVPFLISALDNEDGAMQIMAAQLFAVIGGDIGEHVMVDALIGRLIQKLSVGEGQLHVLHDYGVPSHKLLHMNVIEALGRLKARKAIPALRALAGDEHRGLRRGVAWSLGHMGDEAAIPVLVNLLDDPDPDVRGTTRSSLEAIGTAAALEALAAWRQRQGSSG